MQVYKLLKSNDAAITSGSAALPGSAATAFQRTCCGARRERWPSSSGPTGTCRGKPPRGASRHHLSQVIDTEVVGAAAVTAAATLIIEATTAVVLSLAVAATATATIMVPSRAV